jgi:hypothetical protein
VKAAKHAEGEANGLGVFADEIPCSDDGQVLNIRYG